MSSQVTVYQCLDGGVIAVLQSYIDDDVRTKTFCLMYMQCLSTKLSLLNYICGFHMFCQQKDESFYTVTWACSTEGTPLLVAGGINGIIRVIDAGNEKIHRVVDARSLWSSFHCIYVTPWLCTDLKLYGI